MPRVGFPRSPQDTPIPAVLGKTLTDYAEIELFSRNLQETVEFLNNECTEEQLLWLSEIFEEISAKLQSWEFVDALNRAAQRSPKHAERFSACISYAEGQLNDEVYRQRYPDFGK